MRPAPTRVRWLVLALACAASWLLYLHRYAWGVIKPALQREHPELDNARLGWLDGLFSATYALGQVPGGLLGDLFGPRLVLPLMVAAWSGSFACLALLGRSFWALAGVRAVFGLAQAGVYPILSQVTRRWFPPATRTTAQGAVASLSGRVGAACAPLLVGTLLMGWLGLSWREALLVLSVLGVPLAAAFWLFVWNSPREHPWTNQAEQELIGADPQPAGPRPRLALRGATGRTMAALLLYSFASTFADQFYVGWVFLFLVKAKGMPEAEMGVYATLPLLGGGVGGFVGGGLNDLLIRRTGSRRWGRSAVALTGKGLAAVLTAASLFVADGRWVMVVLLAGKFFGDWGLSTQWGAITDVGGRAAGTVFGVVNTSGSVAAFVAGPAMGHLIDRHGWEGLFGCVAGVLLLSALCWLAIDCTQRLWAEEAR